MDNKKAIAIFILFIAFFYWLGSSSLTSPNKTSKNAPINGSIIYDENFVNNIVKEMSKLLPRQMNKDVQATTVSSVGMKLVYKYNLIHATEETINKKQLHDEYLSNSINSACTTPDVSKALSNGMSVEYQIYDKQNIYLTQYIITSADCNKK